MSSVTIHERFTLDAAPDRVWAYLVDPTRIVVCLPGAELTGQDDERTYSGVVSVKLGAVKMSYRGKVVFEEVDEERYFVRIVGKGQEKTGSGTATMTMESRVTATDGGGTEVSVNADVVLAGKIVRFGRGMIQSVSEGIFQEFTTRLAAAIADETAGAEPIAAAVSLPDDVPVPKASDDSIALFPLVFRSLVRTVGRWLSRLFGSR